MLPAWILNAVAWLVVGVGLLGVVALALGLAVNAWGRIADRAGWLMEFYRYYQDKVRDERRRGGR